MDLEEVVHRPPKEVYRKKAGPLTVVGTAAGVWDDLAKLGKENWGEIMTISDMAKDFNFFMEYPVNHAASMHPDLLPHHVALSKNQDFPIMTHGNKPGCQITWNIIGVTHSGIFGVMAGLLMGYAPITVCGMPCDNSPYYYGPESWKGTWYANENGSARSCWQLYEPYLRDKVFSMSGWTREMLGAPA